VNVLVTGCAGFLGSHVCEALLVDGHAVHGVDDLSTGSATWVPDAMMFNREPVLTFAGWFDLRYDVVIHCAARADIRHNAEPKERELIWRSNVESTHRLVESTVKRAHFIFLSSGSVYGDSEGHHFTRHSPTHPDSLYAASKLAGEAFVAAAGFKRWHVLRCCSLLGPRYHHGHVADFVTNRRLHRRIRALDSGQQVKDYRDVRDVAGIIAHLVCNERPSGVYNVGGLPWSARNTARVMGVDVDWTDTERGWPGDPLNVRLVDDFGDAFSRPTEESVRDTLKGLGWP
jgi:UDP-glucose 4-epimerase